jgi:hypothetical protein
MLEIGNRRPIGIGAGGMALLLASGDEEIAEIVASHAAQLKYTPFTS